MLSYQNSAIHTHNGLNQKARGIATVCSVISIRDAQKLFKKDVFGSLPPVLANHCESFEPATVAALSFDMIRT